MTDRPKLKDKTQRAYAFGVLGLIEVAQTAIAQARVCAANGDLPSPIIGTINLALDVVDKVERMVVDQLATSVPGEDKS